jgi:serine/threonine protein kinase
MSALWQPFVGQVIDNKYHLLSLLGVGAYGGVYRAADVVNDQELRQVAVKLIAGDRVSLERQMQELRAVSQLAHPNILTCYVSSQCRLGGHSFLYIVTEVAEGGSLRDRLSRGPLSAPEAHQLTEQVCAGLVYLHNRQNPSLHRDLKPENILRVGDVWKIADFGLVRDLHGQSVLTSQALGTPAYAPPEAYQGRISTAWDMWSFGAILVESLSGHPPFEAPNPTALMGAVCSRGPNIPNTVVAPFAQIARGCLVRDRSVRWTAQQVLSALQGGPPPVPGRWAYVWASLVILAIAIGTSAYLGPQYLRTIFSNPPPKQEPTPKPTVAPTSPPQRSGDSGQAHEGPSPTATPTVPAEPAPMWKPTLAFTAAADHVVKGSSTTLVWAVEGSSDVRLNGEAVNSQGSQAIIPANTTTYHLVAYGPRGETTEREVTVQVTPAIMTPTPLVLTPAIAAFEAVPASAEQCSIVVLRWTVKNAAKVWIEPAIGQVHQPSGYTVVRPLRSTRYLLSAEGPGGSVRRDVTISVRNETKSGCP